MKIFYVFLLSSINTVINNDFSHLLSPTLYFICSIVLFPFNANIFIFYSIILLFSSFLLLFIFLSTEHRNSYSHFHSGSGPGSAVHRNSAFTSPIRMYIFGLKFFSTQKFLFHSLHSSSLLLLPTSDLLYKLSKFLKNYF